MTMGPEGTSPPPTSSSRPLHNFDLPGLRWGNQRSLRCMKVPTLSGPSVNGNPNASDVGVVIWKRKERENFDGSPADFRRGSDFRKSGLSSSKSGFPPQALTTTTTTECSRKIRRPPVTGDDGDGIAAVREKLMIDLQTETDKMKVAIFREGLDTAAAENDPPFRPLASSSSRPVPSSAAEPDTRPWNLRTRRAVCKAPTFPNGNIAGGVCTSNGVGGTSPVKAPMPESTKPNSSLSPPRLRSGGISVSTTPPGNEKKERPKFSVALSRKEIEEDILAITGRKPHRRPQKRPRNVQKNLDTLFPGLWLTEISADMYKVHQTQ